MAAQDDPSKALIFGAGWIGQELKRVLSGALLLRVDITDAQAVAAALDAHVPTHVINAAGKTGTPNIDALEGRAGEVLLSNVVGPLVLAAACMERGIHFTHLSSGCLYTGDNGGAGWSEDDPPNYHASLYSRSKAVAEAGLRETDALQLRLRMPIASDPHPRNLIAKLASYPRVISTPNSVTILDDAWPVVRALVARRATGVWNLVNDGVERHDELLALYRTHVDPDHTFEVISLEALEATLGAGRSNCVLSTAKLHDAGCALPPVQTSLPRVMQAYARRLARSTTS